jgi:hypothetical protein
MLTTFDWFSGMTEGGPGMDLIALSGALVAAATILRLVIWPFVRALWAAVKAAPKIPIILEEMREILQSDVIGKLEDLKVTFAVHEEKATLRDLNIADHEERLNLHTKTLETHEIRLARLEGGSDDQS